MAAFTKILAVCALSLLASALQKRLEGNLRPEAGPEPEPEPGAESDSGARYRPRYTRGVRNYETLVPRRVAADGSFLSFELPHFYELVAERRNKRRRSADDPEPARVHYILPLAGADHHVELWPNHAFISPSLVVERRRRNLSAAELTAPRDRQCHYVGRVRGHRNSRAALSLCDGMAGSIRTGRDHFFVEPAQWPAAAADGRHVHLAYRRDAHPRPGRTCGTGDDWRRDWEERFRWEFEMNPDFGRLLTLPRRSVVVPRYMETLVVADKKFIEYHKDHDPESYVLTIMNVASDYYHDGSVGASLDLAVVRIIYLEKEEEEMDLTINPNAEKTLESFCKWQIGVNPADLNHPNHHDIAVLLTRYDLCSDNVTNCNLLGLAYVGTACQDNKACCINEDTGLDVGVTVTHEMGHVMGCSHDDPDVSGCESKNEEGAGYIMAAYSTKKTTAWSKCSKRFIGALIDNKLGECLLDEPQEPSPQEPNMLPGAMYGPEEQCRMRSGVAQVCHWKESEMCDMLWCAKDDKGFCTTTGSPAAEGSKCGAHKWCFAGQCVEAGSRPAAVDGGWGEWSQWGECSRTCGGGVQVQERECDKPKPVNRGRYCLGQQRRHRMCSTQPCDADAPTFREQQCTEMNDKPWRGQKHKWKPYMSKNYPACMLICSNEKAVAAQLAPRVKDGTRCRPGTRDTCVSGACFPVGCDWVMGSEAVDDLCGVCGGDGSQCKQVEQTFQRASGSGYVRIAEIPADSHSVRVEELEPTVNTIAVSAPDGKKFYLNGNYTEARDGEYKFGGKTRGLYSHPEPEREILVIKGPTAEPLLLQACFFGGANPGVRYTYYVRQAGTAYAPEYDWEFVDWAGCSARCGGGTEVSHAACVEARAGQVSPAFCNATTRPEPKTRVCNTEACAARWHTGDWGPCSGCASRPGEQNRSVECVRMNPEPDGDDIITESSECQEPKPADKQSCTSREPCEGAGGGGGDRAVAEIAGSSVRPAQHAGELGSQLGQELGPELAAVEGGAGGGDGGWAGVGTGSWNGGGAGSACGSTTPPPKSVSCSTSTSICTKAPTGALEKGKAVILHQGEATVDREPPEKLQVVVAPILDSSCNHSLSEAAEQEMGDEMVGTLDTCKQQVFKGNEAVAKTKEMKEEAKKEQKTSL